jgi:glycosyltransferase involved in cell wall biosynthesis
MSTKIGVGIITCNRPDYLKSLLESLVPCREIINELVVVNDGEPIEVLLFKGEYILNKTNLGVGKSKNKALSYLLDKNCDYIFLIEDDTLILDKNVFNKYIEASRLSGIQHFNYGPGTPFNRSQSIHFDLHNRHQLNEDSDPNPRIVIDYGPLKIALYTQDRKSVV